ncbi:hypothetical protein K491DRAFT_682506 [Lophiostoma macrostomum CBS 122681]|uniref:P-loop containing nucleoside triphosphate hydrolase protein n=1 Tax=Lophiostoma macrostomum CBS 122681 TaxID=1314788 RepID=A0A6A6STD8_9PLEO|nr:hypothetical protein K491DRAFT_682506 [Lophiostoma macrostomum CBS 122681]
MASFFSKKRSGSPINSHRVGTQPSDLLNRVVKAHDPNNESLPRVPSNHEAALRAESAAEEINVKFQKLIQQTIAQCRTETDQYSHMLRLVQERQYPCYDISNMRVMVNGEAGTGKSFTTNNILGHRDPCIQAGGPKGCTNVATEYSSPRKDAQVPFSANVVLFDESRSIDMLNQYLSDCRRYLDSDCKRYYELLAKQDGNSDTEMEEDEELEQELHSRYESAANALTALLCSYTEFRDRDATEIFMNSFNNTDDLQTGPLHRRIKEIQDQVGRNINIEAATVSALRQRLKPFITNTPDSTISGTSLKCCPWPFVQVIKCSVRSRVLQSGVVLVDNPGTGDTNTSHVDKAKESLQDADVIAVVGNIERVEASAVIQQELRWAFKRRGPEGVIMICTKCDAGLTNDVGTDFEQEEIARMDEIAKETTLVIQQINHNFQEKRAEKTDISKIRNLDVDQARLKQRQRALENETYQIRVAARNRTASNLLKEKYKRMTKGASLPVFCISNTEYDKYLSGYEADDPPRLTLELTGIPALRSYIQSLPAKGRFATLEHHLTTSWDTLLTTLELYCKVSKSQQKSQITARCASARKAASSIIEKDFNGPTELELNKIRADLQNMEGHWITESIKKLEEWESITAATHAAIVRHYVSEASFRPTLVFTYKLLGGIAQGVSCKIEDVIQNLQNDPTIDISGSAAIFIESLGQRKAEVERECEILRDELAKKFRMICDRAVTVGATSYFPLEMRKVYDEAKIARRPGRTTAHSVRVMILKDGVKSSNGPFYMLWQKIRYGCKEVLDETYGELSEVIDGIFEDIEADAAKACSGKEDNSPKAKEFRSKLMSMVTWAKQRFEDEVLP